MARKDLRSWLSKVEEFGGLKRISGAALDGEMGAVYEISQLRKKLGAIVFDNIPGYPPGYRIAANGPSSHAAALTLDLPVEHGTLGMVQALREKYRDEQRIPVKYVETGPILENVHTGDDVDLFEFPVPKWHEQDGGPYIGSGNLVITRDPDEGWVNVGTYRVQRHDKNTVGFFISPGKHGHIHREKYFARGEACPVAISLGQDPLLLAVASHALPWGVCEYEYAGGIRGEPIEVIRGPYTGLPIPADAEMVIEGDSYPGETRIEGPFGEFTGYYGSGERQEPFIRVKTVLHRKDPIQLAQPPLKPSPDASVPAHLMRAATVWNGLEQVGIPDIVGVGCYMKPLMTIVSIKQRYPGHSRQVAAVAGQIPAGAYCGRWVIVVDEDIDPTNFDDVMWALNTRCDPATSIDFLNRCWSTPLDPMATSGLAEKGVRAFSSRAIVDACIPYELKNDRRFIVVGASKELKARAEEKYGALLDN